MSEIFWSDVFERGIIGICCDYEYCCCFWIKKLLSIVNRSSFFQI